MTLANTTLAVEIAFSAAPFATSPTWTNVTQYVRKVTTKRGRSNEIGAIESGTATILLDNADGWFTPGRVASPAPYNGNIKPRKQVRIRAVVSNTPISIWTGYTERWSGDHPGGGEYAETTLECVDGLKILGDKKLLDFYGEYVKSLSPTAYYPLTEPAGSVFFSDKSANHNRQGVFYHRSNIDKSVAGSDAMLSNSGGTSVSFDPDGTSPGADIDLTGALSAVRFRPAGWSMAGWVKLAADFYNPNPADPPPSSIDPPNSVDPDPNNPYAPSSPGVSPGDRPYPGDDPGTGPVGPNPDFIDPSTDPIPPQDLTPTVPDEPVDPSIPVPDPDTLPAPSVPGAPVAPVVVDNNDGTGSATWTYPADDGGGIVDVFRVFGDLGAKTYEGAATGTTITGFNSFLCNAQRVQAHNERGWGPLSPWSKCSKNPGELAGPYDQFNRANTTTGLGVADNGNTWGSDWGDSLKVLTNKAALAGATSGGQLLDIGAADQDFTFIITGWGTYSIYFRAVDKDNCYRLDCAQYSTKLYRRIAGVDSLLEYSSGYLDHSAYVWHIESVSGHISVAKNGETMMSIYDSGWVSLTGHKAGLYFADTDTRADEFIPGELTMPRAIRTYPLSGGVAMVFEKPAGYPGVTQYKVTHGGTSHEYSATSISLTGLTDFTATTFTVQAKIGENWGLSSDTSTCYPGYAEPPTINSITPEGGGGVNFKLTLNAPHSMDYSSATLTLSIENAGVWSDNPWLHNVVTHTGSAWTVDYTATGIPTGAQKFRFSVIDSGHSTPIPALAGIATAWSDEVTVT